MVWFPFQCSGQFYPKFSCRMYLNESSAYFYSSYWKEWQYFYTNSLKNRIEIRRSHQYHFSGNNLQKCFYIFSARSKNRLIVSSKAAVVKSLSCHCRSSSLQWTSLARTSEDNLQILSVCYITKTVNMWGNYLELWGNTYMFWSAVQAAF